MSEQAVQLAAIAQAAEHLQAGKMFQLAAYVLLIYDHLITFSDEIERVWKQPWSGATLLFALNRYITPLQFTIIVIAFQSDAWTKNVYVVLTQAVTYYWPACEHFVRFEGGSTLVLVAICEVVMMMRVYALWGRNSRVLVVLVVFWVAQVALSAVAMHFTIRAPLPPGFIGCILTGSDNLFTPFWVMPLISDTVVFALTVWRTQRYTKLHGSMPLMTLFIRDGALYFCCIFVANLLNVLLFLIATEDLKAIGASFSQIITSVLVSRLILNLRILRANLDDGSYQIHSGGRALPSSAARSPQKSTFVDTVMGHLGDPEGLIIAPDNHFTYVDPSPVRKGGAWLTRDDEIPLAVLPGHVRPERWP